MGRERNLPGVEKGRVLEYHELHYYFGGPGKGHNSEWIGASRMMGPQDVLLRQKCPYPTEQSAIVL